MTDEFSFLKSEMISVVGMGTSEACASVLLPCIQRRLNVLGSDSKIKSQRQKIEKLQYDTSGEK